MAAYEYRVKGLYSAPAQAVGELFEKLEKSKAGLTPQSVVDASRDKKSLLHNEFEWDDKIAAEGYRRNQASAIIRNVVVVKATTDEEERRVRGFVSIPGGTTNYVTIEHALKRDEWREHLMKQAKCDMLEFEAKYRVLTELADVIAAMHRVEGVA